MLSIKQKQGSSHGEIDIFPSKSTIQPEIVSLVQLKHETRNKTLWWWISRNSRKSVVGTNYGGEKKDVTIERGIKGSVLVSKLRVNKTPWLGPWHWILSSRHSNSARSIQTARQNEQNWHESTRVGPRERETGLSGLGEERWPISRYSAHMP